MSAITRLRQLAWAVLAVSPGVVTTACAPVESRLAAPAPGQASDESWLWLFGEEDELEELDDEFEGGGWAFWPDR